MHRLSWRMCSLQPSPRRSIRRVRPQLEPLEDRLVLSTFWIPQGPGPLMNGQPQGLEAQHNPDVGAVNALVPGLGNVNVLYAATASGGIWQTTDATDPSPVWTPLTEGQPNLSIGDIAASPFDPNRLYAGTGHFSNGSIGTYGLPNGPVGDGVLISGDGGRSWSPSADPTPLLGQNIRAILPTAATTPTGPVVLAGTVVNPNEPPPPGHPQKGGVYYSGDGGQTWARVSGPNPGQLPDGSVQSLVEDPTHPDVVYAAVIGAGVFQSIDAGLTWQPVNGNISSLLQQLSAPYGLSGTNNLKLAIEAVSGTTTLFLLTGGPTSSADRAPGASYLFYSTDPAGGTWSAMDPVPMINQDDQEGNNLALAADPNVSRVVWVTGSAADVGGGGKSILYRGDSSQPSGSQWQVAVWDGATGNPPGGSGNKPTITHSDGRYLGFDAAGNLLLTSDGGIYKLVNPEGAPDQRYWVSLNGNLQDTELYAVAYDSIDHIIVGGAQDNGMGAQPAHLATAWNTVLSDDVTHVAVDNSGTTAVLYGIGSQFLKPDENNSNSVTSEFVRGAFSISGKPLTEVKLASAQTPDKVGSGLSASDQAASGGSYIPFALDTADPQRLLIGFNDLYVSTNQGDVITKVTPSGVQGPFTALVYGGTSAGTADPDVAFAGTSGGQVFVSTDAGTTFNPAWTFASGSVVRSIALDPSDWHTSYLVTTSPGNVGHVWQMVLGNGQVLSMTEVTGNLGSQASELETVATVNTAAGTALVVGGLGTGSGSVFRSVGSIDGSATQWQRLGTGLPNVNVHDLVYNAADDVLVAATFGRGAWTLPDASQALLPPPPAPSAPPTAGGSSAPTFPPSVRAQLLLDLLLLPTLSDPSGQASLEGLFGAALVLAAQQAPSEVSGLLQQEAQVLADLALGQQAAATAAANALAANPLYNTAVGWTLGLTEAALLLGPLAAKG